jgi:hypothetical protein
MLHLIFGMELFLKRFDQRQSDGVAYVSNSIDSSRR